MTRSYVYRWLNKINHKGYIGKSNNPEYRRKCHIRTAKQGGGKNYQLIHKAISKYGVDNFEFSILEECESEGLAYEREKYWIAHYNYTDPRVGYNMTDGGVGGNLTNETSLASMINKNREYSPSEETRAKIGRASKINKMTLWSILTDLENIFRLVIPDTVENTGVVGYRTKHEYIRKLQIFYSYFNGKNIDYDFNNPNKILTRQIKCDVLNLYKLGIDKKLLSKCIGLKWKTINYILTRYKNGVPTEEEIRNNIEESYRKRKGRKHSENTKLVLSRLGREKQPPHHINKNHIVYNSNKLNVYKSIIKDWKSMNYTKKQLAIKYNLTRSALSYIIYAYRDRL